MFAKKKRRNEAGLRWPVRALSVWPCSRALLCCAQRRRDPLNPLEVDQLRDAMLDPDERLKLYVKFSRDRMTKLEQMRSDPKTTDRARQTHDMLEDFLARLRRTQRQHRHVRRPQRRYP